jgi:hypothetical protein
MISVPIIRFGGEKHVSAREKRRFCHLYR